MPHMRIVAEPELSLVAFRYEPPGVESAALDTLNRDLLGRVNARGNVYMTGTVLHGRFTLRICVLSFRTHMDRMELCLEDIRGAVGEVGRSAE